MARRLPQAAGGRAAAGPDATSRPARHQQTMKQRSVVTVVLLSVVTFGLYFLIWSVQTKNEMNQRHDAQIPTAWLIWVPLWWSWKYSAGVEQATAGKVSQIASFLLLNLFPIVGQAVIQAKANEVAAGAPAAARGLAA